MRTPQQESAQFLVRCAALVGGCAALSGAGASILGALGVINVELDSRVLLCSVAAGLCLGFVGVCVGAWRLRAGAILLLSGGYMLVGFMTGLNCGLALVLRFPAIGRERQLGVATFVALAVFITGIVLHRQIAILQGNPQSRPEE